MKTRSLMPLLRTCAILLGLTLPLSAQTYYWNGAGVSGGTGSNDWSLASNWLTDPLDSGSQPATAPGTTNDISITLNQNTTGPAILLPNGAAGGSVAITGLTGSRFIQFEGNVSLSTLSTGSSSLGEDGVFRLADGAILTFTGGSESTPTIDSISITARTSWELVSGATAAEVRFTGATTVMETLNDYRFGKDINLSFINDTEGASVSGRIGHYGQLTLRPDHDYSGLEEIAFQDSAVQGNAGIINGAPGEGALHNLTNTHIRHGGLGGGVPRSGTITMPEATVRSVLVLSQNNNAGTNAFSLGGDLTITGSRDYTTNAFSQGRGEFLNAAIAIWRNVTATAINSFVTNGNDLVVESTGDVIIGQDGIFQISGSEVTLGGSLLVGRGQAVYDSVSNDLLDQRGHIVGNGDTMLRVRGHFIVQNQGSDTLFDLSQSTVILDGSGTSENPQMLEAPGPDFGGGSAASDGMAAFGFGNLQIGSALASTYVRMIDIWDYSGDEVSDALYLGNLFVHENSVFDLRRPEEEGGYYHVYINGVLLDEELLNDPDFNGGDGLIIIPEPGMVPLALLALVGMFTLWRRRRSSGDRSARVARSPEAT